MLLLALALLAQNARSGAHLASNVASNAAQVLQRGNGPEPDSLDPARAQGLGAHHVLRDLFETLTVVGTQGEIEPGSAQRWEVSADGLEWRFWLDPDSRFADGRLLEAEDFVFALRRALTASTGAPYAGLLLPIKHAEDVLAGRVPASELGVQAAGSDCLLIRLERPSLDLPARLALPITAPLDRHQVERDGQGFTRPGRLNGNGAYRLVEWRPGAWIEVVANAHYRKHATVNIQRVRFHVTPDAAQEALRFAAQELHWTESVPLQPLASLRARFGAALQINPSYATFFLGINLTRAPLGDNLRMRQALSFAIDREQLVCSITALGELPAYGLLPESPGIARAAAPACPLPPHTQARTDCARELWRLAVPEGSAPPKLTLRFNTSPLHRRTMLAVAAMWQETLGLESQLRQEDWKVFVSNRRARVVTQVFRGGWNADLLDPINFLEPFQSQSMLNATGLHSAEFDRLLRTAQAATESAPRLFAIAAAEQELLAQQAIIPLYFYTDKHLVAPTLRGLSAHPLGHYPSAKFRFAP